MAAPAPAARSDVHLDEGSPRPAPPRRRSPSRPLLIAVVILLLAELLVRVFAHAIPAPVTWSGPEEQIKYGQMLRLHREGHTGGIVIVGSSVADVGIDPVQLASATGGKLPVYNAALLGANLETLRWWTDHVVVPLLHPREIVFGLTSREVNTNDPQAAMLGQQFFASAAVHHLDGTESLWERLERYGDDASYLFRYRKTFRDPRLLADHLTPIQAQQKETTAAGMELFFAKGSYHPSPAAVKFFQSTILHGFFVDPAKLATLTILVRDIQADGVGLLVVDTPVTPDYIALHPRPGDYAAYQHGLAQVAAATHVPLLQGQVWTDPFFSDPLHLNAIGAARYTALVAARLPALLAHS